MGGLVEVMSHRSLVFLSLISLLIAVSVRAEDVPARHDERTLIVTSWNILSLALRNNIFEVDPEFYRTGSSRLRHAWKLSARNGEVDNAGVDSDSSQQPSEQVGPR